MRHEYTTSYTPGLAQLIWSNYLKLKLFFVRINKKF